MGRGVKRAGCTQNSASRYPRQGALPASLSKFKAAARFEKSICYFIRPSARGTVYPPYSKNSTMLLATEVFHFEPDITGISCSGRFTLGTRLSETEAMVQTLLDQGVRKLVFDLTS